MPGRWGFCGPTYTAQSPNIDDEDAMNCYCEQSESPNAKTPLALLHTPGLKKFAGLEAGLPEGSVPALFTVNGRTFAAASKLYELGIPGSPVVRGDLGGTPVRPTQITANETQLVVVNNGNLFVLVLNSNLFIAVDMTQFNGGPGVISQIGFSDGYIIATLLNSHTFQVSQLEDATVWNGLDIATISLFPDNITSMICDHREIWFFSAKKTAAYYNAGAGFPPFIPIQGAFLETGAGAAFATVQADNSIFWLSQDERGFMIANRANGYAGQRVSTHATELAWQQYTVTSDAVGYTYQEQGHSFWVILFPSANHGNGATWVYDISTGLWHKRGYYLTTSGTYMAHRSMSHTFNFGMHLVGDWASGNIYVMSSELYTDDGNPIRGYRRSPTLSKDNKRIRFHQFELDPEVGLGPPIPLTDGDGNPRPPQVMLRWSDDAGKTWSNEYLLSVGSVGDYNQRVVMRMLGQARKRVWEVAWTDPIPWRFADAYIEATPEIQ